MSDQDPTTRSYVPGEWYAVLGPSLVLALPPDRRDLAAAAWALVDAGGPADEVLDLVLADGLSDLAGLLSAAAPPVGARRRRWRREERAKTAPGRSSSGGWPPGKVWASGSVEPWCCSDVSWVRCSAPTAWTGA